MRVGIMIPDPKEGSLATADMQAIWSYLQSYGVETQIFTQAGDGHWPLWTYQFEDASLLLDADDLLICYSLLDNDDYAKLRRVPCRIALRQLFSAESSQVESGWRRQSIVRNLPIVAYLTDLGIGWPAEQIPSAARLRLPSFSNVDKLNRESDDTHALNQLSKRRYNLLIELPFIATSIRDDMIQILSDLARRANDVTLHVLWDQTSENRISVERQGRKLEEMTACDNVVLHPSRNASARATLYRSCDLLVSVMEESFSIEPIRTAAMFGLPIFVVGTKDESAIDLPGLLFCHERSLATSIIEELLRDGKRLSRLSESSRSLYRSHLSPSLVENALRSVLNCIAEESVLIPGQSVRHLEEDNEWFGVPDASCLVSEALKVADPLPCYALRGSDRKMDLMDWIFREGWKRSREIEERVRSDRFGAYARKLELPDFDRAYTPMMRLVWTFHRYANSRFDLRSAQSSASFARWYARSGDKLYNFVLKA